MEPNQGRLQTAEHILVKIIEQIYADEVLIGISKFKEDSGHLEVTSEMDFRTMDVEKVQSLVNAIISKNLVVDKFISPRCEVEKYFDLRRVPCELTQLRVVQIGDFDKRPCKDPHVVNTSQIGKFKISKIKRAGRGRYRIIFSVE
jgi:Ser-tRNA(Ala) deacylase AlaX